MEPVLELVSELVLVPEQALELELVLVLVPELEQHKPPEMVKLQKLRPDRYYLIV